MFIVRNRLNAPLCYKVPYTHYTSSSTIPSLSLQVFNFQRSTTTINVSFGAKD